MDLLIQSSKKACYIMGSLLGRAVTIRRLLFWLLCWPCFQATAQVTGLPVSDLSLSIALDPPEPVVAGTLGQITFTFSNAGPDAVRPIAISFVLGESVVFFGGGVCPVAVNDITGLPPNPTEYIYALGTPGPLPPGQSFSCTAGYFVDSALTSVVEVTWETRASNFQGTDPDTSNNFVTTSFGIAPLAVPATSLGALIALILMTVLITLIRMDLLIESSKNASYKIGSPLGRAITIRHLLFWLLCWPCFQATAQVTGLPVSDLSLSIALDPPEPVVAGTLGQITFTFSNAGPDAVRPVGVVSVLGEPVVFFNGGICPVVVTDIRGIPPRPTRYIYALGPPGLLPSGESLDCTAGYFVDPTLTSIVSVTWEVRVTNFQGSDPDPTNNFVTISFGIAPLAVPATSLGALIALILMTVLIALRALTRRRVS